LQASPGAAAKLPKNPNNFRARAIKCAARRKRQRIYRQINKIGIQRGGRDSRAKTKGSETLVAFRRVATKERTRGNGREQERTSDRGGGSGEARAREFSGASKPITRPSEPGARFKSSGSSGGGAGGIGQRGKARRAEEEEEEEEEEEKLHGAHCKAVRVRLYYRDVAGPSGFRI
jgi:hypothetical protein